MRGVFSSIITIVAVFAVLLGFMFFNQNRLVFFPVRELAFTPATVGLEFEDVQITAGDGIRLHGWYLPHRTPRAALLFFHGNAGNISHRLESLHLFHQLGLSVLIIDYRGYGNSGGKPSEAGTYRDAEAAWRYLRETRGLPAEQIVVFGRSLGGAIAAWLAAKHTPRVLIVESSFVSAKQIADEIYPWVPTRWLLRIHYPTGEAIQRVRCPILIVHSPQDDIIPYSHGERLYALAPEPKVFLKINGGHNDGFLVSGDEYRHGLNRFLSQYLK